MTLQCRKSSIRRTKNYGRGVSLALNNVWSPPMGDVWFAGRLESSKVGLRVFSVQTSDVCVASPTSGRETSETERRLVASRQNTLSYSNELLIDWRQNKKVRLTPEITPGIFPVCLIVMRLTPGSLSMEEKTPAVDPFYRKVWIDELVWSSTSLTLTGAVSRYRICVVATNLLSGLSFFCLFLFAPPPPPRWTL